MNPIGVLKKVRTDFDDFTAIDLLPKEAVADTIAERLEMFIAKYEGELEEMKKCQCQSMITLAYNVPHRMRLYFTSLIPIIRHIYENFWCVSQISSRDLTLKSSLDIPTTFYRFPYDDAVLLGLNAAGVAAVGSTLIGKHVITKTSQSLIPQSTRSSEGSLCLTDPQL